MEALTGRTGGKNDGRSLHFYLESSAVIYTCLFSPERLLLRCMSTAFFFPWKILFLDCYYLLA